MISLIWECLVIVFGKFKIDSDRNCFLAGYSDEEYESDPETKVKGPKLPKDGSEDSDVSTLNCNFACFN